MLALRGLGFFLSYDPVLQVGEGVYLREMSGIFRCSAPVGTFQDYSLTHIFPFCHPLCPKQNQIPQRTMREQRELWVQSGTGKEMEKKVKQETRATKAGALYRL